MRARATYPHHTKPLHGAEEIARTLTDYRNAIQWVRGQVVRRANRGQGPSDHRAWGQAAAPPGRHKPYLQAVPSKAGVAAKNALIKTVNYL
ncbi:hypothetical protein DFAR_790005 [Desulfarculales bacterium]